jgi:chromosome segregation ATPase
MDTLDHLPIREDNGNLARPSDLVTAALRERDAARERAEDCERRARSAAVTVRTLGRHVRELTAERNHARAEAQHLERENATLRARLQSLETLGA